MCRLIDVGYFVGPVSLLAPKRPYNAAVSITSSQEPSLVRSILVSQKEVQNIIIGLREAAVQMASQDSTEAILGLRQARRLVVDYSPSELAPHLEDYELGNIYFLRKILGDVWTNIGTDATFDIDDVERYICEVARSISTFITSLQEPSSGRQGDPFLLVSKVIRAYTQAIDAIGRLQSHKAKL
jgi:hypothetical protein